MELFQTGYEVNDAYTACLDMGTPDQLTRSQVAQLNLAASGASIRTETLKHAAGPLVRDLPLRQNDVLLRLLRRL
jgi:xylan 1,4-beta-xylosidase